MNEKQGSTDAETVVTKPRFHLCGTGALLMDFAQTVFDMNIQKRLWSVAGDASGLRSLMGLSDVVLGVNNLTVVFDPSLVEARQMRAAMSKAWAKARAFEDEGRLVEIPVAYDATQGGEIENVASNAGIAVSKVIDLHTSVDYRVSCIGWIPGFAFLSGLPSQIVTPRKSTPSLRVPAGSIGIGGSQTGIIPLEVPTGWHILGKAEVTLFDPASPEPCLLAPGDRVRFVVQEVLT